MRRNLLQNCRDDYTSYLYHDADTETEKGFGEIYDFLAISRDR